MTAPAKNLVEKEKVKTVKRIEIYDRFSLIERNWEKHFLPCREYFTARTEVEKRGRTFCSVK
jgi:hypothetical protein